MLDESFGVFLQIGVLGTGDFDEAVGHRVLDHVVRAEDVVLMDRPHRSDEIGRADHPPAAHTSSCENFSRRVDAKGAVEHVLLEAHLGEGLLEVIVKSHALVDVVLHHYYLRVFLENAGQFCQFFLSEDLSNGIVGGIDD